MIFLTAPACPVPLPAEHLTVEEIATLRRMLPKLLKAANGACPILTNLE